MAGNFNKVILLGNLTRDIELRHTPSTNQPVANFGIAVNRRWRTPEGEQREETTFVDCEAWGRTAEVMAQYLNKGRPVFVEGRLKLDTWQDKESGQNRSKLKVVVETFQFVDSRGSGEGGGAPTNTPRSTRPAPASTPAKGPPDEWGGKGPIGEDDIPF